MAKHEAILEGDDRNFTVNFGPQHPAAHGGLQLVGAKYGLPDDHKGEA